MEGKLTGSLANDDDDNVQNADNDNANRSEEAREDMPDSNGISGSNHTARKPQNKGIPTMQQSASNRLEEVGASEQQSIQSNLEKLGISAHHMSWEACQDTIVQSRDPFQVDMVLTDPPFSLPNSRVPTGQGFVDHIDDKEMELFAQFVRRVLATGVYAFIFTSFHLFTKWKRSFEEQHFVASKAPFVIAKRTGMLDKSSSLRYPQNGCEFAIIAWKRGTHPNDFLPNYTEPYRLIKCSHSRRFQLIDSVPPVRRKLKFPNTNRPVRRRTPCYYLR